MNRISALATAFVSVLTIATALPAQTTDAAIAPAGDSVGVSKVRIVRLSEVKGAVQVDRRTGNGFEAAMANLPIVEHSRLLTNTGVAEVEFEDNSTLRLAPGSLVEFPQMERLASGATVSSVHITQGTAYVSLVKTRGNQFTLLFGQQKLDLQPGSHVRLQLDGAEARLAVLDGTVQVAGPSGPMDVPRKSTITFALQDPNATTVAKKVATEPYDAWDQNSAGYHARAASLTAFNGTPYSYGLNDLSYYGTFADLGGCGSMWRPYFASAAWDPFSNGAWAWYPSAGYSWVSPYPWAWTPYHSGSWAYCSGAGWGWMPGGSWYGLNNSTMIAKSSTGRLPLPPNRAPKAGEATVMAVNLKPIVSSELASSESFVFRKDSAGLGIPRDTLGKLDKLSRQTVERGTATTPVYVSVPRSAMADGRYTTAAAASASIHRGSASSSMSSSQSHSSFSTAGNSNSSLSSASSSVSMSNSHASSGSSHGH